LEEARQLTDAMSEDEEVPMGLTSSMEAARIGFGFQENLERENGGRGEGVDEDAVLKTKL
jgi:hypothetical protein